MFCIYILGLKLYLKGCVYEGISIDMASFFLRGKFVWVNTFRLLLTNISNKN